MVHELETQAALDGLTGLGNRRRFNRALEEAWRRSAHSRTPVLLALIDIDRFKAYNDCYGHPAGDACLAEIARTIQSFARHQDDSAALLATGVEPDAFAEHCEALRQVVAALTLPHTTGIVTISIDVAAVTPQRDVASGALIERADRALYRAKALGRDQVQVWRDPAVALAVEPPPRRVARGRR